MKKVNLFKSNLSLVSEEDEIEKVMSDVEAYSSEFDIDFNDLLELVEKEYKVQLIQNKKRRNAHTY